MFLVHWQAGRSLISLVAERQEELTKAASVLGYVLRTGAFSISLSSLRLSVSAMYSLCQSVGFGLMPICSCGEYDAPLAVAPLAAQQICVCPLGSPRF